MVIFPLMIITAIVLFVVFWVMTLYQLRDVDVSEGVRVAWACLIVFMPIFGGVAFLIVSPGADPE